MENLIRLDISKIPKEVLKILLKDRSTKKNILWGDRQLQGRGQAVADG